MARTRKKKAGNIFSSKDKSNEHMYPIFSVRSII